MSEKLLLGNTNTYDLAVNGARVAGDKLLLAVVVPDGKTLEDVKAEFSTQDNTAVIKTTVGSATRAIFEGYTHMGSQCTIDDNAKIRTEIIPAVTDEAGNITQAEQLNVIRGTVAYLTLEKENLESRVSENRADIDYVMMMGGM